jgi:hypothetical protein
LVDFVEQGEIVGAKALAVFCDFIVVVKLAVFQLFRVWVAQRLRLLLIVL